MAKFTRETHHKDYRSNLEKRHRYGAIWRSIFMASTVVGIIALTALLFNIIDGAFGYAAIQNKIHPDELLQVSAQERILSMSNVISNRSSEEMATGVAFNADAIGILPAAVYEQRSTQLLLLGGTDDWVVVASGKNEFLTDPTQAQLWNIISPIESWNEIEPSWPDRPIRRYVGQIDEASLQQLIGTIWTSDPAKMTKDMLVAILEANVSAGLFRRYDYEISFSQRMQEDVYQIVLERVIEPTIVDTWSLFDSIFHRQTIVAQVEEKYPGAFIEFASWLDADFIASQQSSDPQRAGVRTAILGSLWTIVITILFAFPLGVGAAIYLEEYALDNWINRIIRTNINNLSGVPSIIYGMLGLAIFVRLLESFTSGTLFGLTDPTTANGRTIISAGLTLGLLILPMIIINAQEAIRAIPNSLRHASYGLGATKWQTIWHHVLPNSMAGILTGTILAISRAVGETAPLVVVGASTFITVDPAGPFSKFTTLPIQIYQWTARPQGEYRNLAAAAILVLLFLLLTLNSSAILLRNRYSKRLS